MKYGMNYLFFGGWLNLQYAYVDLNVDSGYVADSLFIRHKVPVKYQEEIGKDDDRYRVIFCKIRRRYRAEFEKALVEITNKMYLLGYGDYEAYCCQLTEKLKEDMDDKGKKDRGE